MELSTSKIEKNFVFQEMELFSSKIKKFLIFPEMVLSSLTFFYISGRKFPCPKNKKNAPGFFFLFFSKKKILIFCEMKLFYIFLSFLSYNSGNRTFLARKRKQNHSEKASYILENGIF